jgi:Ca2+-binding RTX toxin-like protein
MLKFWGGAGNDIIGISTFQGVGQADGGAGDDILFSINSPFATPTGNILRGGLGKDQIFSSVGDDTIYAGAGDDMINLRGGMVDLQLRSPFSNELYTRSEEVIGGGNDTVYLEGGRDTVVLGSAGRATIYGFGADDRLNVAGHSVSFTRSGSDTLIQSDGNTLGVLKGYAGSVGLA